MYQSKLICLSIILRQIKTEKLNLFHLQLLSTIFIVSHKLDLYMDYWVNNKPGDSDKAMCSSVRFSNACRCFLEDNGPRYQVRRALFWCRCRCRFDSGGSGSAQEESLSWKKDFEKTEDLFEALIKVLKHSLKQKLFTYV